MAWEGRGAEEGPRGSKEEWWRQNPARSPGKAQRGPRRRGGGSEARWHRQGRGRVPGGYQGGPRRCGCDEDRQPGRGRGRVPGGSQGGPRRCDDGGEARWRGRGRKRGSKEAQKWRRGQTARERERVGPRRVPRGSEEARRRQ